MAVLRLPDGRTLGYAVMGDQAGRPVLVLHGTPGSARQLASLSGPARDRGLALIAPDRAGYGGSTYDPARTIASGARDVGELIRHAGLAGCAVVGISGGGPTALACGAVLAGQVSAIATVGGVAPLVPRDPALPPDRAVIRAVPVAHARVIAARCPTATLHIVDGGGHLLLGQLDEILASVAEYR